MEITPNEFQVKLNESPDSFLLVDVRENDEREFASILPSLHLPLSTFAMNFSQIEKDKEIIIYCHHGMRSLKATHFLIEQGYDNVRSLIGGIDVWSQQFDSSIPRY